MRDMPRPLTIAFLPVNYQPVTPAVPVPYVIAIVKLEEQPDLRIASNIVDCEPDSVYVGLPVEVRFEPHDSTAAGSSFPCLRPERTRYERRHRTRHHRDTSLLRHRS